MTHSAASRTAVSGDRPAVERVPDLFKLTDVNPLSGVSYAESVHRELPPYAASVIGMAPQSWDNLALAGQVFTLFDPHQLYNLAPLLRTVRARRPDAPDPAHVCGDCFGTYLVHDFDASMTGDADGVYICYCAPGFDW